MASLGSDGSCHEDAKSANVADRATDLHFTIPRSVEDVANMWLMTAATSFVCVDSVGFGTSTTRRMRTVAHKQMNEVEMALLMMAEIRYGREEPWRGAW